jgi:hypothetical protein
MMADLAERTDLPERKPKSLLRRLLSWLFILFGAYVGLVVVTILVGYWCCTFLPPESQDGGEAALKALKETRAAQGDVLVRVGKPTYHLQNVAFEHLQAIRNVDSPPQWPTEPPGTVWIYDHFDPGRPDPGKLACATAYVTSTARGEYVNTKSPYLTDGRRYGVQSTGM